MSVQLETIKNAVIAGQHAEIKHLVQSAIDAGYAPKTIINDALIAAMDVVGDDFGAGRIFVPELMVAALTMEYGLNVVKPHLAKGQREPCGTIVLASVEGDLHDIGKNLVAMMLEGAGFRVRDLGVDVSVEALIEEIRLSKPDIVGLSALLTTTTPEMQRVIGELQSHGLRDKVKVLVGGAPVNSAFADEIGADGYGADAAMAVKLARRFVEDGHRV